MDFLVTIWEAKSIRIKRPISIKKRLIQLFKTEHISETQLDEYPFDFIIKNNHSLEELGESLYVILETSTDLKYGKQ